MIKFYLFIGMLICVASVSIGTPPAALAPVIEPTEAELWESVNPAGTAVPNIIINEIVASNATGLRTRQGKYEDWVELFNPTTESVNISGWYLTDSLNNLAQWQFPDGVILKPGGFMIVFCDGWVDSQPLGEYHSNFSLSKSGEYLALVAADAETIVYELAPSFPPQYRDASYGCIPASAASSEQQWAYYKTPTPGAPNTGTPLWGMVESVTFSESQGYKSDPFNLTLESPSEGAIIYYTLDGTIPTPDSLRYTGPISIDKITFMRAVATKEGYLDAPVATRTWLFMEDVLTQPTTTPTGWPSSYSVNNHKMEYGMNSSIVRNNKTAIRTGMTNIQTISLVTDLKNLFDSKSGIYVNPGQDGEAWERPVSMELIDPRGGEEFQIEAGLRIRGAFSRSSSNPKHSLRLFFRDSYGGKLNFPLFEGEGADTFDKVDLRTSQNFSWSFEGSPYNTFIRETFSRDAQGDFGMQYTRSRYYHLFINGQYWGLYQTQERSDSDYAKTYFGGSDDDWDCIKTSQPGYYTEASDGNMNAFSDLYNIAVKQGFSGLYSTNYYWIKGVNPDGTRIPESPVYLDEDNLIAYMLITYFARDPDCPVAVNSHANNLYGLYNRVNPTGFKWFKHDGEHSMAANRSYPVTTDLTSHGWHLNTLANFNPMRLHQKLMDHPDYKMRWVDTVQKEMLNPGGALTLSNSFARWNKRQAEIDQAIILEAARWGHGRDRGDWIRECDYVKDSFIALSADYLMKNFKSRGWFPTIEAPVISDVVRSDESVTLTLSGALNLYYTLNGEDPRLPAGELNPFANKLVVQPVGSKTLIPKGDTWKFYDEGIAPPKEGVFFWYQKGYSHSYWKEGAGRFGFGYRPVNTSINRYKTNTNEPLITAYFSKTFEVASSSLVPGLNVDINADDGAVVYINGTRVLLHNMVPGYNYNTLALSQVSGSEENTYYSYKVDSKYLIDGENLISVEVHQASLDSEDFYFDLELSTEPGQSEYGTEGSLTVASGTVIKARSWNGVEWSPITELDLTVYGHQDDLKINEMMYSSPVPDVAAQYGWDRDDFSWIELKNTGKGVLDTQGIRFTSGIDYAFPQLLLHPSEMVVLVKNVDAFSSVYLTNGMTILSGYSGNLARRGEKITIQAADGSNILSFDYSSSWYPETDQGGYSLEVVDTSAEESLWSSASNWKSSSLINGTPGAENDSSGGIPPIIKIQPKDQWVFEGENVLFYANAVGTSPLSYQWYKDGILIEGANTSQLIFYGARLSDAGCYSVEVTNPSGTLMSRQAKLLVQIFIPVPPSIILQPENQIVMVGESASFIVAASGSEPLNYQWYKNGIPIEGAVRNTYTIPEVSKGDQANLYTVRVSNMLSSLMSVPAGLTVMDGPIFKKGDFIIAIDPNSSSYPSNENPPLAIDRDTSTKYLNFGGANSGFIATPSVGHSLISSFVITTANDVEGRDPASYDIYGTNEKILSKDKSPGNAEGWTWIASGSLILPTERFAESGWINIENNTPYRSYKVVFPSLKVPSVGMMQLSEFQFYGVVWTNGVPVIATQPSSYVVLEGGKAVLSAVAMGTLPLSYQWYKDGNILPGETASKITFPNSKPFDSGVYSLEVKNSLGTTTSTQATLTVIPEVIEPPTLQCTIEGDLLVIDFSGALFESADMVEWTLVENAQPPTYKVEIQKSGNKYYLAAYSDAP